MYDGIKLVVVACAPLAVAGIGAFVLFKSPKNAVNRYFAFFNFSLALWNIGDFFALFLNHYHSWAVLAYRVSSIGGVFVGGLCALLHCVLVGDTAAPRFVRLTVGVMTPVLGGLILTPLIIADLKYGNFGFSEVQGPLYVFWGVYLLWGVSYGVYRQVRFYRRATGAKRIQAQYVLVAFAFVVIGILIYSLWSLLSSSDTAPLYLPEGPPLYLLYYLFEIGYSLIMAHAILQHGALDIKTVIHKTLLWLATSAAAALPAIGAFWLVSPVLEGRRVLSVVVVALICFGLLVYARMVQPYVDHRFQRRRYDLYRTIQNLTEELVVLKGVDEVSQKVVHTVDQVLYASDTHVAVFADGSTRSVYPPVFEAPRVDRELFNWLGRHNDLISRRACSTDPSVSGLQRDALAYLDSTRAELLVPFVKDGVLLGLLHIGSKRNLQPFSALDIEFLNRLRTEVTVAYHNSILYENITALSKQLERWNVELEEKIHLRTQELEGAYNQLKELDEAKTRFFATVSHELRTPLTLILAPLESVLKGDMGPIPEGLQRHVAVMHQNGLRLLKQINNLLDLTKLDAGRMTLQCRSGDLRAFFRGLVASVAPMAEKKRIELKGYEDAPLPRHAYFDPDRLEKVVLNLVFNAIKFTNAGGRVELRWGRFADGQLQVQVKDTGIGIAEKDLPKLFKRFSQVDASTSRRYEGTGIGLALAKEIVELHGGRIGAESKPGRGSTFTFTIPLLIELPQDGKTETVREPGANGDVASADWTHELHVAAERQLTGISPEPTVAAEPSLSPANGRQVLVVEDNPDMREFIAFELQGEYRVLKAANGIEGVRVAVEQLPDVIVSDVMMPEMDGYQLCREIRKDPRTKHIPIILLTARADMAMKIEGLEHGADDYLTKPFNAQELRAKIKSLLEQRRLEREIQQRNEALEAALEELKATQTQLVQSEKMAGLGMLVAGMAHEINNPINFAKNSLSVLQRAWEELKPLVTREARGADTVEAVEDVEASLGIVRSGVSRTEQIVGQLKAFVRKDQNQKVVCSVQEGLESTLNLVRPTMGKQIVLHAGLQSSGAVLVVPGKLNQVWMNLLQNAAQALGSSGEIWVESRDHEHMVTVTVRDSGPGIKAEHMPRLFEPFFTTKPVGQGTGLGLSVSYQIVQDAGGRIDVKSQPGQGAEFTVVLPLAQVLTQAA